MCVVCTSLSQKDYIESALAVKSTINGEAMTIPLTSSVLNYHTIEPVSYTHLTLPTIYSV